MTIIKLAHDAKLKYAAITKKTAPSLPEEIVEMADQGATVVTFRPLRGRRPNKFVKRITAVDRFQWIENEKIILFGLETDSPLAPLIIWDIAHNAAINSTISVVGNGRNISYLQRDYFKDSFELIEQSNGILTFKKILPLLAEQDSGLDAWTFGIPVGPEDATLLNATVKRILELDVPHKEILLCGRPGENFLYFDKVRIVGEDITAPPVQICAKKNRLAQEAKYPNLCIIHDRIFLPKDFYSAVKKFGDCYPLTSMQSLYFDDKFNLVPRRYSDFGVSNRVRAQSIKGLMRNNDAERPSEFAPSVLPITEFSGFFPAHAMRYNMNVYPTGSMYICKRAVWLKYPQNENLHWIEFEDLEHGFRASDAGIPSRINPYALTQSLISRPLLSRSIGSFVENIKGQARLFRPWTEPVWISRKPAIKLSKEGAFACMNRFAQKYVPPVIYSEIPVGAVQRTSRRLSTIINVVNRVKVPLKENALRGFLHDFEKLMVFDQLPFNWIEQASHRLLTSGGPPSDILVHENEALINHAALRPQAKIFYESLEDYLQSRSLPVFFGSLLSALYLFFKRNHVLYLKGGVGAYFRAILNSTPFIDYGK